MFRVQGFEDMMLRGVPSSFGDVKTPYVGHLKYIISCKKTHKYDLMIEIPSKCIFSTIGYHQGGYRVKLLQGDPSNKNELQC